MEVFSVLSPCPYYGGKPSACGRIQKGAEVWNGKGQKWPNWFLLVPQTGSCEQAVLCFTLCLAARPFPRTPKP